MQPPLISHSPDLKKLWDEGYAIEIKGAHLLVHDVPYVNSNKQVKRGTLVSTLTLATTEKTAKPDNHVIHFIGDYPCRKDGAKITGIEHQSGNKNLGDGIIVNHSFSNKPKSGYQDYYEKVARYCEIISGPAKSLEPNVTELTFNVPEPREDESAFNYLDTNSTRAEIGNISQKLSNLKIAIVGLGGTGSYILDLVSKTPVKEIHLFDSDFFHVHNAFRTPGGASVAQLKERYTKIEYLKNIYSNMHRGIIPHYELIGENNVDVLAGMDFVFLSMDNGSGKKCIVYFLEEKGISFIDVGIGVLSVDEKLIGIVRTTTSTKHKRDHVVAKGRIPFSDGQQNEYSKNIQIAELNALNAVLAVIKWKKLYGYYHDIENEHFTAYTINTGDLLNEDYIT